MSKLDEYTVVGIIYSLIARAKTYDNRISKTYQKASESSVDFDKQWGVFVKECRDCLDEFEEVYERISKEKRGVI